MSAPTATPPVLLRDARSISIDAALDVPAHGRTIALAMRNGRIDRVEWSGSLVGEHAEVIDAGGAWLMPGFVDAHVHLVMAGRSLVQLDLSDVTSRTAFERAIAAHAATLPEGAWLEAHGWSETNWRDDGGSMPDASWLAAAGDRPCVCYRMDHHACVVNDAVLRLIESIDTRPDPAGGTIVRRDDGEPTGLLLEAAAWQLVNPLIPLPDAEARREAARRACAFAAKRGIVAVNSMEYDRDLHEVLAPLRDARELAIRVLVTSLDRDWPIDPAPLAAFANDDRLAVIGCKAFLDGTLGSRTAAMLEDYADDPGNAGMLVELAEQGVLDEWIARVLAAGLSPSMHAIGDRALRLALDTIDRAIATSETPIRRAPRIEHAQTVHPADLPRLRGRVASMQPLHRADDARVAFDRLGEARMSRFFPFRSLQEAGALLAFGSDWPIVTCDPMPGLRSAITGLDLDGDRCRPEECLTVRDALRAWTHGSRAALGLPPVRPVAGDPADLVLLDRDPLACDWERETPRVLATFVGGRCVHRTDAIRDAVAVTAEGTPS